MAIGDPIREYNSNIKLGEIPTKIDEVSDSLVYVGYVLTLGASSAASIWKIKRIQKTGTVWEIMYADGDDLYDNVWSNRASLVYK